MRPGIIVTIVLLLMLHINNSSGQPGIRLYSEFGNNASSRDLIVKTAVLAKLQIRNNKFTTGFRADLKNNLKTGFSASLLKYTRIVSAGHYQLCFSGYIMNTPFSDYFSEKDLGVIANIGLNRTSISLGMDMRSFVFNRAAFRDRAEINSRTVLHESWNLLYSFEYQIIRNNLIYINISVSDFDDFSVSQMINPVFSISAYWRLRPDLGMFINSGLKGAGILSTNLNYFGSSIKTGMTWNF